MSSSSPPEPKTSPSTKSPTSTRESGPASRSASPFFALTTIQPSTTDDHHDSTQTFPPLTTHWSKPLSCTWTYVYNESQPVAPNTGAIAWLDLEPVAGASTLSCYPKGMFDDGRTGVFSPATCPQGWTTASVLVNTNEPNDKATTTAICCSSEYSLDPSDGNHCKRSVPTILAVPITYNRTGSTYDIVTTSTTTLYSATLAVNTIRALFRQDDKKLLGITDETQISDDDETPSNSLSTGARIGIGIGVTVFVLLLIGGALLIFFSRRRSKRLSQELYAMQERRRHESSRGSSAFETAHHRHGSCRRSPEYVGDPSAPYEVTTETESLADTESGNGKNRDDQMKDLVAQKLDIQRRIEELEHKEPDEIARHEAK